jgi:multidrug efflux system membrane fusion protein
VTVLDRDNVHALATGTLTTFDSQIDVTTGTIKMRSTFANPDGVLFPQQFVNVRLLVDTMTGVTLAPNPAIQLGASGNFVYLLDDDATVSKRDVAIGPTDGKHTVITSGLKAGDKVVIDGVDRLRDGAKVKIVDHPAAGSGQAGAGAGPGSGGDGSGAGSGQGNGQHHRLRHDQSGAAGDSGPPSAQTNPAPAAEGAAHGPAQGEASSAAPAPGNPTPQGPAPSGAAAPQPATGGAPAQGSAK